MARIQAALLRRLDRLQLRPACVKARDSRLFLPQFPLLLGKLARARHEELRVGEKRGGRGDCGLGLMDLLFDGFQFLLLFVGQLVLLRTVPL